MTTTKFDIMLLIGDAKLLELLPNIQRIDENKYSATIKDYKVIVVVHQANSALPENLATIKVRAILNFTRCQKIYPKSDIIISKQIVTYEGPEDRSYQVASVNAQLLSSFSVGVGGWDGDEVVKTGNVSTIVDDNYLKTREIHASGGNSRNIFLWNEKHENYPMLSVESLDDSGLKYIISVLETDRTVLNGLI